MIKIAAFREYVQLSNFVYSAELKDIHAEKTIAELKGIFSNWRSGVEVEFVGEWKLVHLLDKPLSGFFGAAFQKGSEVVVAYRGTEPDNVGDWMADAAFVSRLVEHLNPQMTDAVDLFTEVRTKFQGSDLSITGHSLGGGLAQKAAMAFNIQAGDIFIENNRDQLGISSEKRHKVLHFEYHPIVLFNADWNDDGSLNESHIARIRLEEKPGLIRDTADALLEAQIG